MNRTRHISRTRRCKPVATASVAALLLVGIAPALARQTAPAPTETSVVDSTNPGATPMDQIDLSTTPAGQTIFPPPAEPEKVSPFFSDARFSLQLRTYYFYRDKYDDSLSEAWALGGSLSFKSGYLGNVFAVGATGYTSQPLYAPDDRDGTLLLESGQDGYTVLGQAYGEFKLSEHLYAAIGLKEYNTPYINKNDTRMTPNTFEGATMYGKAGGENGAPAWRYGGGYLTRIKERNSNSFEWMSHDAGSDAERGVALLGANVDWDRFSVGAMDYFSNDIINIFYAEAKYSVLKGDGYELKLAGQFTDQRSVGSELLTGDDFSADQWGVKSDLSVGDAVFTVAYTGVFGDDGMQSPWGGYPGYTSVQVQDFFREGEQAVMLRASYDFTNMGLDGASAYALWVHGFGVDSGNSNEDEWDANLQWAPKNGPMRNTSFRLRYAFVKQRGDGDPDIQDFRFIVNYDFPNR